MMRMFGRTGALVVALAWASVAAAQGLYWESTTTGLGDQARTAQFYAVPKMLKIVQSDGAVVILRSDQDKIIAVNTRKQMYREMTLADVEAAAAASQGQMAAKRGELEKRMKELPPEQRAMMEQMLANLPGPSGAPPAAVSVQNTGETKIISGHACTKYIATQGDKTVLTAWATKDVKGFDALRDDWLKLQKRMSGANPTFGSGVAAAYAQIEGFPIETDMGTIKAVVTKVESRNTPASEFEVPAGYTAETVEGPKAPR